MTDQIPNPGSKRAYDAGCTCPVLDNAHGYGWHGMAGIFVYDGDCPLHKETVWKLLASADQEKDEA
jgi:hypothetical protein